MSVCRGLLFGALPVGPLTRRFGLALALLLVNLLSAATSRAETFPFTGIWEGTSRGGDDATWTARVDNDGQIRVEGNSRLAGRFTAEGVVTSAGGLMMRAAGSVSTTATYRGTVRPNGTTSGTWENRLAGLSGTFTGRRTSASPIAAECRQEYTSADPSPAGYGAAYDAFARNKPQLIRGLGCATPNATVSLGSGATGQYIYRYAYEWRNNQWFRLVLEGPEQRGDWFVGSAMGELTRTIADLGRPNVVIAYICQRAGGSWRCGCSDTACQSRHWQLQSFARQAAGDAITGTWRGNVLQPGAPRYSVTFRLDALPPQASCGTVDYPEIACGGELRNCQQQNGEYVFDELLRYGQGRCDSNIRISARLRGDQIDMTWFYPNGARAATAVLSKP